MDIDKNNAKTNVLDILHLVNEEREGVLIDRDFVKGCINEYNAIEVDAYESDFECKLIESTRLVILSYSQILFFRYLPPFALLQRLLQSQG